MSNLIDRIKRAQVLAAEQVVIDSLPDDLKTAERDFENQLPEWATGHATSSLQYGAQLATRDGRRCGNAVVFECHPVGDHPHVKVCTDAGTVMIMNAAEIDEVFYPARWTMDPSTAPGLIRHTIDTRNAKVKKYVEASDNGLPEGAPESDYFILEHAHHAGFEMVDDDGDVFVCSARQVVALVKPYKERCALLEQQLMAVTPEGV